MKPNAACLALAFLVCVVADNVSGADDDAPIALLQPAEYVDLWGKTQDVRVVVMISGYGYPNVNLEVDSTGTNISVRTKTFLKFWNMPKLPIVAARAQKWAVESKAKHLVVADRPLIQPNEQSSTDPSPCSLLFFTENAGMTWGVRVAETGASKQSVCLRDKQAEEFCQVIQDITTPLKQQRAITRGKIAVAEAKKNDARAQPPPTDDAVLKY